MLIGTPVDFKRFYLDFAKGQRFSTINIEKLKDSLDTDYPRDEEDLQIYFSQETLFGCFFGTLPSNVSIQNPFPPEKKIDFVRIG